MIGGGHLRRRPRVKVNLSGCKYDILRDVSEMLGYEVIEEPLEVRRRGSFEAHANQTDEVTQRRRCDMHRRRFFLAVLFKSFICSQGGEVKDDWDLCWLDTSVSHGHCCLPLSVHISDSLAS